MITKDNDDKVMELFFKFPLQAFHIREIARLTGLSSTGVIKIVKKLKKEKLLDSKKSRVVEEVRARYENEFILAKRLYNIYSLYETGLIDALMKFYERPRGIILFGSYSKGTDTEKSDIDIAVVGGAKIFDASRFEGKLVRKVSVHAVRLEAAASEFRNSLANGIVLEGFVEFTK